MSTDAIEGLRFKNPPVRGVHLSVYFSPVPGLQVSGISGLIEKWRVGYPSVSERVPAPPWNSEDADEDSDEELEIIDGNDWPFPQLVLNSPDDGKQIVIQDDRFSFSWHFGKGHNAYPGFAILLSEMTERWNQFVSAISRDELIPLSRFQCHYHNRFAATSVSHIVSLLVPGVISTAKTDSGEIAEYLGVRKRISKDVGAGLVSSLIALDSSLPATQHRLFIRTHFTPTTTGDDLSGLQVAHDELIGQFSNHTTDELRAQWEQI